ncbi:MAG: MotA/TolQ/ExbB proton channel family protein [Lentisphaeria bacterium]|nr:MotA/TolQ/ExbB proton channel family protein [Lentisphaeria bacterium]
MPSEVCTQVVYAWRQSDPGGKGIVLLLFLLSIYAWTIMLEKGWSLWRVRSGCKHFLSQFDPAESALKLVLRKREFGGPIAEAYFAALNEVMDILNVDAVSLDRHCEERSLPQALTDREIDKVRATLERVLAAQNLVIEERLGVLGSIVTISPFLGLLGTVWGVMLAFIGMAQKGRPDISAIAPGVSGALLTTVVGLLVAIPSVAGLNTILNGVKRTNVEMDNFVEDFSAKLRLQVSSATIREKRTRAEAAG